MTKKVQYFANGIELTPVSADPVSPAEGDFQYSDGTARAEGVWQYKGGAWIQKSSEGIPALAKMGDTQDLTGQAGKIVKVNVTEDGFEFVDESGGVATFLDLTDAPSSYSGQTGKIPAVNSGENALEFIDPPTPALDFLSLTDTPSDYTGQALKTVRVNAAGTGIDFIAGTSSELLGLENYSILSRNAENQPANLSFSSGKGTSFFVSDQGSASGAVGVFNVPTFKLSGVQSYNIISADENGSTNDWFALRDSLGNSTITIDNVHRNQDIIFTFDAQYDGASQKPEGLKAVIRDVTNGTNLSELDFVEDVFIRSGRHEIRASIPDSCTQIAVGFYFDGVSPAGITGCLIDNCYVTRAPKKQAVITDWQVGSGGAETVRSSDLQRVGPIDGITGWDNKYRHRRVGDSIEMEVFLGYDNGFNHGGSIYGQATSGEEILIALPNNLKIDITKCFPYSYIDTVDGVYIPGELAFESIVGTGKYDRAGATNEQAELFIVPFGADGVRVFQRKEANQLNQFSWSGILPHYPPNPITSTSSLKYTFRFTVPVQGWSATE